MPGSKSRDLICGTKEVHTGPSKTLSKELASKLNPDAPGCRLLILFPTWTLWQGSTAAQPIRIQQIPCRCPWAVGSSQQQLSIFSRGEKKQPELMQRSHTALLDAPSKPSGLPWKNPTFSVESFDF
jgi:hypothetical protein